MAKSIITHDLLRTWFGVLVFVLGCGGEWDESEPDEIDTIEQEVTSGLVAHWKFDETSGTSASDSSGGGNTATLVNGPTWTAGRVNGGLSFDGVDDQAVRANAPAALKPANAFAIAAWVKTTATDTTGGEIGSMGNSYLLRVQADGNVRVTFYDGSAYRDHITTGVNVKDGTWHHIVGQYTGSALQVYVDGVAKGSTARTGSIQYTLGTGFVLGNHGTGLAGRRFKGVMDEVRVYGRALTGSEIAMLAAGSTTSGLVAHWRFDETTGTSASDSSGGGNTATLMNGPTWTAGRINGGLSFDGVDDQAVRANAPAALKPANAFAIAAWVKTTATDTTGGEIGSMGNSYFVRVQADGNVRVTFYDGSAYRDHITTGVNVKDGTWHHIVGQYTGSALQVYVDGVAKGSRAWTGNIQYTLGTGFVLGNHGTGFAGRRFKGVMDDVRVYSRALSGSEIATLAPASSPRLRVVSWNLQFANNVGAQAQRLADQAPDVILVQELPDYRKDTLRSELNNRTGATWTFVYLGGVGLYSRRPVLGTESRSIGPNSYGPPGTTRTAVRAAVDVNGAVVNIFGTHLDYNPYGDMTNHIINRGQFLAWVDSYAPRKIAGGDLNAWTWGDKMTSEGQEQDNTIAAFDARLTDLCASLRGSHDACNSTPTNGGWRPDYIYRSSGLSSVSYKVVSSAGLSDHNLVVVEIGVQ